MRTFFKKTSLKQWAFAFEGRVPQAVLQGRGLEASTLAERLLTGQTDMEDEIQTALAKALRADVSVELEIDASTFEWFGEIEALCEPGFGTQGLMGLRRLVGSTISRVLAKHLPADLPRPSTRVAVTAAPAAERTVEAERTSKPMLLLVLSTICLYIVALVVLGLIAMNLLGMAPAAADGVEPTEATQRNFTVSCDATACRPKHPGIAVFDA